MNNKYSDKKSFIILIFFNFLVKIIKNTYIIIIMDSLSFKTNFFKPKKNWILVDATNKILGRLSSKISIMMMGKHKTCFAPHIDCGDYIIVINSDKIKLTGKKWNNKQYIRHTGYPGGRKIIIAKNIFKKDSRILIYKSIKRMLPKNRLGRLIFRTNLYVYKTDKHKHIAQKPRKINIQ